VLKDITAQVKPNFDQTFPSAAVDKMTVDGKIHGGPRDSSMILIWYNKALAAKAGVDVPAIKTWEQFLAAVTKAKDAGVTPMVLGGKDKWPAMHIYAYLALRLAGADGLVAARAGKDGGFASSAFVKAGDELKRLGDLKPFQTGFADAAFEKAAGQFGDGKALFDITGSFGYGVHQRTAADGKGVPDADLGMIPFPMVEGGKGDPTDVIGGAGGFVVTAGAPKEAVDFLVHFVSKSSQERAAATGLWIPFAKGAGEAMTNPFFKQISTWVGGAKNFQLYLDQALGAAVGGALNDASIDILLGTTTPKDAAATIEEARRMYH